MIWSDFQTDRGARNYSSHPPFEEIQLAPSLQRQQLNGLGAERQSKNLASSLRVLLNREKGFANPESVRQALARSRGRQIGRLCFRAVKAGPCIRTILDKPGIHN